LEDNTRLNSIVSHDTMIVNEKFKSPYPNKFKCFLFIGTNEPVRITDAKSGLLRRLIDVQPTGNKVPAREYRKLVKQIDFELGAIAQHCLEVYQSDPDYYENYIPTAMLGASNDFYNFVIDSYTVFKKEDGTSLKAAYEMYKAYCDDARVLYPYPKRAFKEELKKLEINSFLFEVDKITEKIDENTEKLSITQADIERVREEFEFTKQEYDKLEEELSSLEEELEKYRNLLNDRKLENERADGQMLVIKEKLQRNTI
jgi:phage/plasmid-associated DNA primase